MGEFPDYPDENWRFLDFRTVCRHFRTGCSEKGISERVFGNIEREVTFFRFPFGFSGFSERGVRIKAARKAENTKHETLKKSGTSETFTSGRKAQDRAAISGEYPRPSGRR